MPPDLLRWYNKLGLDLVEVYGMTENCGVSHTNVQGDQRIGTVGPAYPGTEVRLDPQTQEILVRGLIVFMGYLNQPEKTREALDEEGLLAGEDHPLRRIAAWAVALQGLVLAILPVALAGDDAAKMQKLLDVIEDLDDVQNVFHNAILSE